jgi:hypothetical protein
LIEHFVQADVPIAFLAFPRFVTDQDYLFRKLSPLLPVDIPIAHARQVHANTFQATNVEVERELGGGDGVATSIPGIEYPTFLALDNAALKREANRLRAQLSEAQRQCAELAEERNLLRGVADTEEAQVAAAEERCATLERERNALHEQLRLQHDEKALLMQEVLALHTSRSWPLTRPLRLMISTLRLAVRTPRTKARNESAESRASK